MHIVSVHVYIHVYMYIEEQLISWSSQFYLFCPITTKHSRFHNTACHNQYSIKLAELNKWSNETNYHCHILLATQALNTCYIFSCTQICIFSNPACLSFSPYVTPDFENPFTENINTFYVLFSLHYKYIKRERHPDNFLNTSVASLMGKISA